MLTQILKIIVFCAHFHKYIQENRINVICSLINSANTSGQKALQKSLSEFLPVKVFSLQSVGKAWLICHVTFKCG